MVDVNVLDSNALVGSVDLAPQVPFDVSGLLSQVPYVGNILGTLSPNEIGLLFLLIVVLLWTFKGKSVLMILQVGLVFLFALVLFGVVNL